MKKRESFCTNERCNVLFAALTEFHRLSSRCGKGESLNENAFDECLKNAKADSKFRHYKKFIKEELVHRKVITATFSRWNSDKSLPTYLMAETTLQAAVKRLSKYNLEHKAKATKAEEPTKKEVKKEILLSRATLEELTEAIRKLLPKDTSYTIYNK